LHFSVQASNNGETTDWVDLWSTISEKDTHAGCISSDDSVHHYDGSVRQDATAVFTAYRQLSCIGERGRNREGESGCTVQQRRRRHVSKLQRAPAVKHVEY
jgi:hypothetical protein